MSKTEKELFDASGLAVFDYLIECRQKVIDIMTETKGRLDEEVAFWKARGGTTNFTRAQLIKSHSKILDDEIFKQENSMSISMTNRDALIKALEMEKAGGGLIGGLEPLVGIKKDGESN